MRRSSPAEGEKPPSIPALSFSPICTGVDSSDTAPLEIASDALSARSRPAPGASVSASAAFRISTRPETPSASE
jgi:hypothetical protein